jgi:hypothetical protein
MMQDRPTNSGSGPLTLFGPVQLERDSWFLGADVRQSQLKVYVKGPRVIGADPTAAFELDVMGVDQINGVPGAVTPVLVPGDPSDTRLTAAAGTSAQGDESVLPRLRVAYMELNWNEGEDALRVGQYFDLLLAMVLASVSHIGPFGYEGGQISWRSPRVTYVHRFKLGDDVALSTTRELTRNSWADNMPNCSAGRNTATTNCLPSGVSLGEASALLQVQMRVLLGPPKPSPLILYAPSAWQVHAVLDLSRTDLSGIGADATPGMPDSRDTWIGEAGFKLALGPVLLAANGWWGRNAGNVFGQIFQMQAPTAPELSGFGAWCQAGLSITQELTLWTFAGVDRSDTNEVLASRLRFTRNVQLHAMLTYAVGQLVIALEYLHVATDAVSYLTTGATILTTTASQYSITGAYFFFKNAA